MMLITLQNARQVLRTIDDIILQSYIYDSKERKYWKLHRSIQIKLSNGDVITIPKGFVYDQSSSPRWTWSLMPPFGNFLLAALIHDYIYIHKTHSKDFADKEMFIWSELLNDAKTDNKLRYWFVKHFGMKVWRRGRYHPEFNPNPLRDKK